MPTLHPQQIQQVLRYLRVWVQAFQNSVELAAFAAEDVLAGKETQFSDLDKNFLLALDHVIYHTSHSVQAAVKLLRQQRAALTQPQLRAVHAERRHFRRTTARFAALMEALEDIYVFRKPPH